MHIQISNSECDPLLQERVVLTQKILALLIVFSLPYVCLFYYFGYSNIAISLLILEVLFGICWFSAEKRKLIFSRLGIIITANAATFYFSQVTGTDAGIQILHFSMMLISLAIFLPEEKKLMFFSVFMAIALFFIGSFLPPFDSQTIVISTPQTSLIRNSVALANFLIALLSIDFVLKKLQNSNKDLQTSNTALQTAYEDLQLQQNLLEKTWQEYGFTSKLSGTLRLSEIVDLTAKTILLHFGLTYAATITSDTTSTLHTWTLENQIPVRTREDVFESQICYTHEKGPLLNLSAAHLSTSVLNIVNPAPSIVLHLAITENESRYILIGPKSSGGAFSESDMKLMQALSIQAIIALQRALPYEEAVQRYGMAIKQESAYQMLVSLQHQINSPLSAAKMAMDTLSKTSMETNTSIITKMGKEAIDAVAAVMHRMRQVSRLKETTYLGDVKMWEIGDPDGK